MVQKDITAAFERLAPLAARLNEESDTLNDLIEEVEAKIRKLNVGLTVWLERPLARVDEPPTNGQWGELQHHSEVQLGVAKIRGRWKLVIRRQHVELGLYQGDPDCPWTKRYDIGELEPLLEAPRDYRVEAVRVLPELLAQLADRAESAVRTIRRAQNNPA